MWAEGENNVMLLQAARYLVKAVSSFVAGEKLPSLCACLEEFARLRTSVHFKSNVGVVGSPAR